MENCLRSIVNVCVCLLLVFDAVVPTPVTNVPENDTTSNDGGKLPRTTSIVPWESMAPDEFPTSDQNYTFVDDPAMRENFLRHSEVNATTRQTEVKDLLAVDEKVTEVTSEKRSELINVEEHISEIVFDDNGLKSETELIENDVKKTEDGKLNWERTEVIKTEFNENRPFSAKTSVILTLTFLLLCLVMYLGLMRWRKRLENRYGSRQMLVTEEDFDDPHDIKHFSI